MGEVICAAPFAGTGRDADLIVGEGDQLGQRQLYMTRVIDIKFI